MTISDAQDRLSDELDNVDVPDNMNGWDMEDWTVFALDYLRNNIREALDLESTSPDVTKNPLSAFAEGSKLWTMIFNAMKTTGNSKDALSYIEESLTGNEYYELEHFFDWLDSNGLTIGHGNYFERYTEYVDSRSDPLRELDEEEPEKTAQELWKELGNVPVDLDGLIEIPFLHFDALTDREEIWHWFENTFDIAVHDLMYPKKEE